MRLVQALAVVIVLAAVAAPVVAQTETELCLRVRAAPEADLTDAAAVEDGIIFGDIMVTEVVPCDAATAPVSSATPASDVGTGAWVVGPIEVDPVTDDRRAQVSLTAASSTWTAGSRTFWTGEPYTLTIECTDGSTRFTVTWLWDLGPERLIDVDTRIGDGEVTREPWFNSGQATSFGGAESEFIESIFGETELALRVDLARRGLGEADAVFDITGIENAVANVRETCGW
jgi:predicted dehydrogenase